MVWRIWSLLAGLPVGALAAWAIVGPGSAAVLAGGAAAGALAGMAAVSLPAAEPDRRAHRAAACGAGWVALPALLASALRLGPSAAWWLAATLALLGVAFLRASRGNGSIGIGRAAAGAAIAVLGGSVAVLTASAILAASGAEDPGADERRAAAIFDLDAAVATRPLPRCEAAPSRVEVLLEEGAHPRLGSQGRVVWFDAPGPEGRRQIHRLDPATRESVCWTCGEPGNNVRPAPGNRASGVVFDTDRHTTGWDPGNTEIHVVAARGDKSPPPSRRLTYNPGPDDHAILSRATGVVIWSRYVDGSYRVVSAPIRSAHGGLMLGGETLLAAGGSRWAAPLAWSPDARALVVVRGNPFRPLSAISIDFAEDHRLELAPDAAGASAVSFSADGGWVAVASADRARLAGLLPESLGFALGPFAARAAQSNALFRGTRLRTGETWGERSEIELGEVADWGEPTGLALSPDGETLVLGQRRRDGAGAVERLLEIGFDCDARAS